MRDHSIPPLVALANGTLHVFQGNNSIQGTIPKAIGFLTNMDVMDVSKYRSI